VTCHLSHPVKVDYSGGCASAVGAALAAAVAAKPIAVGKEMMSSKAVSLSDESYQVENDPDGLDR